MDDKDLEKKIEELKNASEVYRHIIEENEKAAKSEGKSIEESQKASIKMIKHIEDANKMYKRSTAEISASLSALNESYKKQDITAEDLEERLASLRNEVNRSSDQSAKANLIKQKSELEAIVVRKKFNESMEAAAGLQVGVVVGGFVNAMTGAAKTAMSTGDGIQVAGGLMTAGIDIATKSVQAGAKGISDVGGAMMNMGGKSKFVGMALTGLGTVAGATAGAIGELAKAGVEMLIKAVTKSIETFRTMSQSGALFANGVEGMRTAATGAGMTLEDFSKVTVTNKEIFAKMGLGVSGGIQKLSGAMNAGGKEMREQLFALGYSMEDQGNLMAQTMSIMADPSGKLKASNEQVAAATKKYAQDLTFLSAITGEDMKAKQEKIKQENVELAVQQKLAKMTPEDRAKFNAMQASMTDTQRRQLKERMVYGTVISTDLAIMEATSSGMKEQGDAWYRSVKDGTMGAEKAAEIQQKYGEQISKDYLGQESFGAAASADASGVAATAAKGMSEQIQNSGKWTKESIEQTKKDIAEREKQAKTDPFVRVQDEANDFALTMQKLTDDNLDKFGKALGITMNTAQRAMTGFANFVNGITKEPTWVQRLMEGTMALVTLIPGITTAIGLFKAALAMMRGGGGGGDGMDLPDGKGKPKGPDGKPKGRFGKAVDLAKNFGGKILGLGSTAAEAAAVAAPAAANTATAGGSLLSKGLGVAAKGLKFLGPAGVVAGLGYGGYQGYQNAGANFDLQPGKEATTGQKLSSTAAGALSSLTFGLVNEKTAAQGIQGAGSSIGNFLSKAAGGAGSLLSGGAGLIGGAASALAGKVGLGSGYSPTGGMDPKLFLEAQKDTQSKLDSSMKDFGVVLKEGTKANTDVADLLRTQLAKQDELIKILTESLDIHQRTLTTAQG